MEGITCFIETNYGVDHSKVKEVYRTTFATVGDLFEGKPICAHCINKLSVVADAYVFDYQRRQSGGATNADAHVSCEVLIERSPLKAVFADYNLADLKWNLDKNLFELEPVVAIQPSIATSIDRIDGAIRTRELGGGGKPSTIEGLRTDLRQRRKERGGNE